MQEKKKGKYKCLFDAILGSSNFRNQVANSPVDFGAKIVLRRRTLYPGNPVCLFIIYGWRWRTDVPELSTSVRDQLTVRAFPLSEIVVWVRQYQLAGQYTQVRTPFDQDDFVTSLPPRPELTTEVTTYVPFCQAIVDRVPPPLESGSSHFPARPGSPSWPASGWDDEDVSGATVSVGLAAGGSMTGSGVADERVADGSGDGSAVSNGAMVACGVGVRELHETTINIPAMLPIKTSQNFLFVPI